MTEETQKSAREKSISRTTSTILTPATALKSRKSMRSENNHFCNASYNQN